MNNHRLLTGLLVSALVSGGVCASGQTKRVFTIEELFETAETGSAQLAPFFTAEEEAERRISVARNQRMPDIDASLSISYIGNGFTTRRDFTDYQKAPIPHFGSGISLTVTQPVYTGGAITSGIDMARLKSTSARQTTEQRRNNLRILLTELYLDLYKYSNLRNVVEKNIVLARKVLEEMTVRHEQGVALQNDITRYELLVSNLELQLVKLTNTLDIINRNLVVTAGLPESTTVQPDTTILARSLPLNDETHWQREATLNSPLLKLARTGVEMSRTSLELVKSNRKPKIGVKAGWTVDGPILVEVPPINRNLSYWYVGIGVSYNLASLYKTDKALSKSRAATRKAEEELDAAAEKLSLEINADYIHYLEAYVELKTQTKSVELAERNYKITSTRYSADMALITDMIDAANAKLDAEQKLVNSRINIIYSYYKLLYTSGKI